MKIDQLERCLTGKLKLRKKDETRHTDYQLRCNGGLIPLPRLLRMSRGSGEITDTNFGGIAKALGLNEHALRDTEGCRIGRPCILLCLTGRLLDFIITRRQADGDAFRPGLIAMVESIELILEDCESTQADAWTPCERKALDRWTEMFEKLRSDAELTLVVNKILALVVHP